MVTRIGMLAGEPAAHHGWVLLPSGRVQWCERTDYCVSADWLLSAEIVE